jgi:sugar diacid utilization regulator
VTAAKLAETLSPHVVGRVGISPPAAYLAVAAERLFCHRNTVLNRLRRAEGLMGLDLSRPQDLTTLIVVLESLRLLPAPTDEA